MGDFLLRTALVGLALWVVSLIVPGVSVIELAWMTSPTALF